MEYKIQPVVAMITTFISFIIGDLVTVFVITHFNEESFGNYLMSTENIICFGILAIIFSVIAYIKADKERNQPES